jgi:subtilisin family serine protease|tara:strand:- start:28711 stop:29769 length:1059 start_codon:yes stop_codon:yes gene_type:complete
MKNEQVNLPDFAVDEVYSTLSQSMDWSLKYSNIPETWKTTKGEGITIAVIDTGLPDHPDIGDNAVEGKNCITNEDIYDYNGHQTHCVGIISAKDNQQGFVGVAPNSKCICIKALGKNGSGSSLSIIGALDYAIKMKPDIVSMSLGFPTSNPVIHNKIKTLYSMNIPVVCAAGNSGKAGVNYPAAFPETIAVGAFDKFGNIAGFSSRGSEVDWAAPGANIISTYLNKGYASLSGTSMACPFIAGIIALMLAKHNKQEQETGKNDCKTVADIRHHLIKYTNDKGTVGKDEDWGYGVIDIESMFKEEQVDSPIEADEPEIQPIAPPEPKKKKISKSLIAFGGGIIVAIISYFLNK